MGFYTTSLLFPTLIGLISMTQPEFTFVSLFGVIMQLLWAASFLLGWRSIKDSLLPKSPEGRSEKEEEGRRKRPHARHRVPQLLKQVISFTVTSSLLLLSVGTSLGILGLDYWLRGELIKDTYSLPGKQ